MPSEEDFKRFMETSGESLPAIQPLDPNKEPQPASAGPRRSLLDVVNNPQVLSEEGSRTSQSPSGGGRFSADGFYSKLKEVRDNPDKASSSGTGGGSSRRSETMKFYEKLRGTKFTESPAQEDGGVPIGFSSPGLTPANRALPENTSNRSGKPTNPPLIAPPSRNFDPNTHTKCPNCSSLLKIPKVGWNSSCSCGKTYSRDQLTNA